MQTSSIDLMRNVSIQQAYEWVKDGHWTKATFIEWASVQMQTSFDAGASQNKNMQS